MLPCRFVSSQASRAANGPLSAITRQSGFNLTGIWKPLSYQPPERLTVWSNAGRLVSY
jgi:hypothetical protein